MRRFLIALLTTVTTFSAASLYSAEWVAKQIKVHQGFDVPESVAVDQQSGVAYVSNIVAEKEGEGVERFWADDGTGFISRIAADGKVQRVAMPAELKLNAPKGVCLQGGALWIADNARLVRLSLEGKPQAKTIRPDGAERLNDVATDGESIYVSDTGAGKIFRVRGEKIETLPAPEVVNGVTLVDGQIFCVSWGLHEVYTIVAGDEKPLRPWGLAEHFKTPDGIERLDDGSFLVSDLQGNKVSIISADKRTVRTLIDVATPADIGLDRQRKLLYVPSFMEDRVLVYQLSRE
jgi:DNA-binding beta-propeller fold protein YncE